MKKFFKRLAIFAGLFGILLLGAYEAPQMISLASQGGDGQPSVVHGKHAAAPAAVTQEPLDRSCFRPNTGAFNGAHEYACAYQAFRALHIDLADPAKMSQFVNNWNPKKFAGSDAFKTPETTFRLIRQMRDSLRNREFPDHDVFDYVNTPVESGNMQTQVIHPVLDGGIGAQVKLNNDWQIRESVTNARPDPKAPFKNAGEFKAFEDQLNAAMVIGPGHELTVVAPVKNSPSEGKLQDNDFILAIDGTSLNGKTLTQAVSLLRGPVGTTITVRVQRQGVPSTIDVKLTRGKFDQHAVTVHDINGIRHIILDNFSADNVVDDFYDALAEAQVKGMKGIDIDVRGNPGGRLDYVTAMVEMVVDRGEIIKEQHRVEGTNQLKQSEVVLDQTYAFTTEKVVGADDDTASMDPAVREDYTPAYGANANDDPSYVDQHPLKAVIDRDMPVTVDVNGQSYSAAEIFTGALQFTHRATIIGQPSPGKGIIMTRIPLPDGGELSVTSGRYFPGGLDTENVGILPDQEIVQPDDFGKTDAVRDAASAEIEKLHARLVQLKSEGIERVKINLKNFNDTLDGRNGADKDTTHPDSGQ